jgi:hypothetical protein
MKDLIWNVLFTTLKGKLKVAAVVPVLMSMSSKSIGKWRDTPCILKHSTKFR